MVTSDKEKRGEERRRNEKREEMREEKRQERRDKGKETGRKSGREQTGNNRHGYCKIYCFSSFRLVVTLDEKRTIREVYRRG